MKVSQFSLATIKHWSIMSRALEYVHLLAGELDQAEHHATQTRLFDKMVAYKQRED